MADTKPGDNNLKNYWLAGPGAAKIRWSTPGDWTRCVANLSEHVGPQRAKEFCSRWHKQMTGEYTGSDKHRVASGQKPRGNRIGPG